VFCLFHHLLDASEIIHELADTTDGFCLIDGNIGFGKMRLGSLDVSAGSAAESLRVVQSAAKAFLGRPQLVQQRLSLRFDLLELAVAHSFAVGSVVVALLAETTGFTSIPETHASSITNGPSNFSA